MNVGDLVRVIRDGTLGLVVHIEDGACPWIYVHTGESFLWRKWDKLEVINERR